MGQNFGHKILWLKNWPIPPAILGGNSGGNSGGDSGGICGGNSAGNSGGNSDNKSCENPGSKIGKQHSWALHRRSHWQTNKAVKCNLRTVCCKQSRQLCLLRVTGTITRPSARECHFPTSSLLFIPRVPHLFPHTSAPPSPRHLLPPHI